MSAPANLSNKFRNGNVSFWVDSIGEPKRRPGLPEDLDVDVAIAGGGMTALWTAYYLKKARPELAIVVLEKDFCGFGASGRNEVSQVLFRLSRWENLDYAEEV